MRSIRSKRNKGNQQPTTLGANHGIEALRRDIASAKQEFLPSLGILAARYGVSTPTLSKAAAVLRHEGAIMYKRGGKILITGRIARLPIEKPSLPWEMVYTTILDKIKEGMYRAGTDLPKRAYLSSESGVSLNTVARVLRGLATEKCIHRAGKNWAVGSSPSPGMVRRSQRTIPFIVVIEPKYLAFRNIGFTQRYRRFSEVLNLEADARGIRLMPVLAHVATVPEVTRDVRPVQGLFETLSLIKQSGPACKGVLLLGDSAEFSDKALWKKALCSAKLPVVWFDRTGLAEKEIRAEKNYVACSYSERNGLRVALEELKAAGHRKAAYLATFPDDWAVRRGLALADMAPGIDRAMTVVRVPTPRECLDSLENDRAEYARFRRDLESFLSSQSRVAAMIQEYVAIAPSLSENIAAAAGDGDLIDRCIAMFRFHERSGERVPHDFPQYQVHTSLTHLAPLFIWCMRHPDITAYLSCNDIQGKEHLSWLRRDGVAVPREKAILSFDNSHYCEAVMLSSVDFGFGYLGYAALHAMLGDIPLKREANGIIYSRAQVVHRGTI